MSGIGNLGKCPTNHFDSRTHTVKGSELATSAASRPRGLQPLSDLSTPGLGPHYILYVATSLRDWRGKEEEEKGQMSKQPFPSCSSPTIL